MESKTPFEELRKITENILEPAQDGGLQKKEIASRHVSDLGYLIRRCPDLPRLDYYGTLGTSGDALSPQGAARCLEADQYRTYAFIVATRNAVLAALEQFQERPIHVLEAGSGPFAPLTLPLTTIFPPDQVRFSAIDMHITSVLYLKRLIEWFGIQAHFASVTAYDAFTYQNRGQLHGVVLETMRPGLLTEPQAALTEHLAPQVKKGGFFIPEEITLWAAVQKVLNGQRECKNIGDLATIRPEPGEHTPIPSGVDTLVTIPSLPPEIPHELIIETRVHLHGNVVLEPDESNITTPLRILSIPQSSKNSKQATMKYAFGKEKETIVVDIAGTTELGDPPPLHLW